jgi:hypothetical protein
MLSAIGRLPGFLARRLHLFKMRCTLFTDRRLLAHKYDCKPAANKLGFRFIWCCRMTDGGFIRTHKRNRTPGAARRSA